MTFAKDDITYHSYHHSERRPAVNVKVYDSLSDGFRQWHAGAEGHEHDPRFTLEWIEEHVSDEESSGWFDIACQSEWEMAEQDAQEIWHSGAKVYSEGRMGGWAIVEGVNMDVDSWDAIELAKWARFAKLARGLADGVMYLVVDLIYINRFEQWAEEQSEVIGADAFAPELMSR